MYIPPNKYPKVAKRGDLMMSSKFLSVRRFLHPPSGRHGTRDDTGGEMSTVAMRQR